MEHQVGRPNEESLLDSARELCENASARLQRQMDALDNEYDEPGFMEGRKQLAA